ncbi:hypothetical protein PHYSODRAFT_285135 [Phytophthora sojae]|uniref:RxLR effector protein n=2 Tax=Phytophthora sojae TaxID=67593 RepID=G4YUT1_PHYSP|nr:hypothetical protein PHYSODRAFT_285135 [Phytophthora sojae]AEK80642.1 Avh91 [Phytophthora sojae]AEK80643.1 Avh91 [Phytophthora sojae]AEK80644.1 Avh91 [Phytophthora sojae]EGZ26006.1 hypothetical protein PHYSODRAFT_285135 [Phytophthora sojae]|eukprot:XP_009521294.1 hypothetical protein PHYSODRAFT_285135 [Phytophthora sojae]
MRLAFVFATVIAATLLASGSAFPSAMDPSTAVGNTASSACHDPTHAEDGRQLRRVDGSIDEGRLWSIKGLLAKLKLTKPKKLSKMEQFKNDEGKMYEYLRKQAKKLGME